VKHTWHFTPKVRPEHVVWNTPGISNSRCDLSMLLCETHLAFQTQGATWACWVWNARCVSHSILRSHLGCEMPGVFHTTYSGNWQRCESYNEVGKEDPVELESSLMLLKVNKMTVIICRKGISKNISRIFNIRFYTELFLMAVHGWTNGAHTLNKWSIFTVKKPKWPLLYVEKNYQKIFQEYLIFDFTQNYLFFCDFQKEKMLFKCYHKVLKLFKDTKMTVIICRKGISKNISRIFNIRFYTELFLMAKHLKTCQNITKCCNEFPPSKIIVEKSYTS